MKAWYFENIEAYEPKVGFTTQFEVKVEDRTFTHQWKITKAIPNQKLTYNWKYKEYPGDSFVTFEIFEENGTTKLKLSVAIIEDFPSGIPEFSRESCIGGWNYFIDKNLKEYIETK